MNLAMQTRRAMITLGLVAAAMLCVAARSASTADLHAARTTQHADARKDVVMVKAAQAGVVLTVVSDRKARKLVRVGGVNTNG